MRNGRDRCVHYDGPKKSWDLDKRVKGFVSGMVFGRFQSYRSGAGSRGPPPRHSAVVSFRDEKARIRAGCYEAAHKVGGAGVDGSNLPQNLGVGQN
jgi:hypothetical protein